MDKIKSLADFSKALAEIDNAELEGKKLYYRGHSRLSYEMVPNLYRKENYYLKEDLIYRDALVNLPHEFYNCKTTIEVLVKMQHYEFPTRLMDLTRNSLVALYFACIGAYDEDGEVLLINIPESNVGFFDSDKITILANIAKQKNDFGFSYNSKIDFKIDVKARAIVNEAYFGYLLHSIKEDKAHFYDNIDPRHVSSVFAVEVKMDNPRIIRQHGAFLIFGVQSSPQGEDKKSKCPEFNQDWILKPNGEQLIIDKDKKQDILKELDRMGINRTTLFPELNVYADHLKAKYKDKSPVDPILN